MSISLCARAGLLLAAVTMGGCVGGSPAGSLMGIAAGFDPTGISGMVAGQVMAAEAQAAASEYQAAAAAQQAQAQAMLQAYAQAGLLEPGAPGMVAYPGMAGAVQAPPAVTTATATAPSAAEQAAIAGLAASPVGTSITWTDPATGDHGRVTVRSIEQGLGRSCRHITRTVERATGPVTSETSVCSGDASTG